MKVYSDSVGHVPFWWFQGIFVLSCTVLGVLWTYTHFHGPSVEVSGLRSATDLPQHRNDRDYAQAMARRFTEEYLNWSYQSHFKCKRQAAYLCNEAMQRYVITGARNVDSYYRQLHQVSSGRITKIETQWEDPKTSRFQVAVHVEVHEWQGYVESMYPAVMLVQLGPSMGASAAIFALEVTGYDLKQLEKPILIQNENLNAPLSIEDEAVALAERDEAEKAEAAQAATTVDETAVEAPATIPESNEP